MPVMTQGFQVQNMPRVDFQPVSALTPAYGDIVPNVSRGVGFATQLQQIADEARLRPLKKRLLEIQQAEAEARLGGLPLQQEMDRARLAEIQQNAAVGVPVETGRDLVGGNIGENWVGDTGEFSTGKTATPLQEIISGYEVGAGGVKTPFKRTITKKTPEMVLADKERADALNAASVARAQGRTFEYADLIEKAQAAEDSGDTELAKHYYDRAAKLNSISDKSPWVSGRSSVDGNGNLVLNQVNRFTGELRETPTGRKPSLSEMQQLILAARGGSGSDAEVSSLLNPGGNAAAPVQYTLANPAKPSSKAEYDALPSKAYYVAQDGSIKQKK